MGQSFEWVGGHPALDFCNTVSWRRGGKLEQERFLRPDDLSRWARHAGMGRILPGGRPARRRWAPALRDVHALRGTLHALFSAVAEGRRPDRRTVRAFQRRLDQALGSLRVLPRGGGLGWAVAGGRAGWDPALVGVVWSAARLATSPDAGRIRLCANGNCGWLFLDESRRLNRRWCDMRVCGSRAKARRYYARRRHRRGGSQRGSARARA